MKYLITLTLLLSVMVPMGAEAKKTKSSAKITKAKKSKVVLSSKSPIYVDGQFSKSGKDLTSAEKIRKLRRKLEKKHEIMVKQRIELIRYQREIQMMKRLEKAMNNIMNNLEGI